jgi:lactam utilization protein B
VQTICIHSDAQNALQVAQRVVATLKPNGVRVAKLSD